MACKKSGIVPDFTYRSLKVLELKTNLPIAGAEVRIYECKTYGFGGCSDVSLLRTLTTDKDGNFQFDLKLNVFVADATHDQYWDGGSGGETFWGTSQPVTDIYLTPVAYTKLHIKRINPHSPGLSLVVNINRDSSFFNYGPTNAFAQPDDTTVVMPSYGYTNNILSWHFSDAMGNVDTTDVGGQLPSYYISRFDTASMEINY
jgi:hypothetical protein